jgi:NTP pyrophosphatase (non-canonical NTP hydrolase)
MMAPQPILTLDDYQKLALSADKTPDQSLAFPLLGLFGEAGSLLSVIKKKQRDRTSYLGYEPHVIEELGDVLWYFAIVAARGGLSLSTVGHNLDRSFADWQDQGGTDLRFTALQATSTKGIQKEPTPAFEKTSLDLAADIGALLADHQAGRLSGNQSALKGHLVTIMRALVKAASEAGVALEKAAQDNLAKIFDRWPSERIYPAPLDEKAKANEQLPRALTIDIFEREVRGQIYVFQRSNGINIGDRLTDNALEPDDYRFHDVFHYAYCAVLTWSPVVRALLHLKRKSDPRIDEAEDGARAILIEEGIATWIFGQAKQLGSFEGIAPGGLSFDILKTVRQFVAGYEPQVCPLWLWEEAILQGFEAFRFLREKRRARLRIDMMNRRLVVGEMPIDT